ncbi:MAG: hypothetical protein SFY80_01160 [Verrucomicrobiota bacterium]|nr:hypothetical protein [Verrucomicrobiota bacterium]
MKKYLLLPLIATVLFAFYYSQFMNEQAAKEKALTAIRLEQEAKANAERIAAIEKNDAIAKAATQKKLQLAAEKKAKIEAQNKYVKQLSKDFDKANVERDDKATASTDLRNEYLDLKDANERSASRIEVLEKEKEFLVRYVPVAEANVNRMKQLLVDIEAWEKNQAELAKKAAADAKTAANNR